MSVSNIVHTGRLPVLTRLYLQDLENTNFSIHLPRASFDRHATGRLVLRAVQSLGIDAHLNDRNDICVGSEKMSLFSIIFVLRSYILF